jgi:Uri superfamily endonuclease
MKGTYVLVIEVRKDAVLRIGSMGRIGFRKGFYAYVGSGMGSLEKRVERHLKRKKKRFWHIDSLISSKEAKILEVLVKESEKKEECQFSKALERDFESVRGFGCSDCECRSHLFYSEEREKLLKSVRKITGSPRGLQSPRLSLKPSAF